MKAAYLLLIVTLYMDDCMGSSIIYTQQYSFADFCFTTYFLKNVTQVEWSLLSNLVYILQMGTVQCCMQCSRDHVLLPVRRGPVMSRCWRRHMSDAARGDGAGRHGVTWVVSRGARTNFSVSVAVIPWGAVTWPGMARHRNNIAAFIWNNTYMQTCKQCLTLAML